MCNTNRKILNVCSHKCSCMSFMQQNYPQAGADFLAASAGRAQEARQGGAKKPAHLLLAGVGAAGGRV